MPDFSLHLIGLTRMRQSVQCAITLNDLASAFLWSLHDCGYLGAKYLTSVAGIDANGMVEAL
jgi:hypothetical protein